VEEINALIGGFAVALSPLKPDADVRRRHPRHHHRSASRTGGAKRASPFLLRSRFTDGARSPAGTTSAIILLSCIYWGALFGGAITSVLFNHPGGALVGCDDVRRATRWRRRQGGGRPHLQPFTSSFVGALIAVIMITFLSPWCGFRPQVRPAGIHSRFTAHLLRVSWG